MGFLCIGVHPDDCEIGFGGTAARLAAADHHVQVPAEDAFQLPGPFSPDIAPDMETIWDRKISAHLASLRGLNPDTPRGLSKVTLTM